MQKIILADNQDLTKAGWLYLLNRQGWSFELAEHQDKKGLIAECLRTPDAIIILDYNLFDFAGVTDLLMLTERFPKTSWIICSESLSEDFIRQVIFGSETVSILLKDSSAEDMLSAVKQALKKERYISSYISNLLLTSSRQQKTTTPGQTLTATEKEILREMALGKSTREIASLRHASMHTIMTHRKNIFRKIGVNNVHEATKYAMRAGLIDMAEYYI